MKETSSFLCGVSYSDGDGMSHYIVPVSTCFIAFAWPCFGTERRRYHYCANMSMVS
jgi:hypothetical protein